MALNSACDFVFTLIVTYIIAFLTSKVNKVNPFLIQILLIFYSIYNYFACWHSQ